MAKNQSFKNIDDYINKQSEEAQNALRELRSCILKAVPEAEETFTYNVPAFILIKGGKMEQQVMIAAFKKHVGFYPHDTTIEHFLKELTEFKTSKGTVRFPLGNPIPCELVIRMVKYRKGLIDEGK